MFPPGRSPGPLNGGLGPTHGRGGDGPKPPDLLRSLTGQLPVWPLSDFDPNIPATEIRPPFRADACHVNSSMKDAYFLPMPMGPALPAQPIGKDGSGFLAHFPALRV